MMANKYLIGFLTLVILTASVYVMLPNKVKIEVTNSKTIFKVWENNTWVLAGTEYSKLYNGSKLLTANSRSVNYSIDGTLTKITRKSVFGNSIIIDTYSFDGKKDDVKLYPISHEIRILNAKGKIFQYEANDLSYNGIIKTNLESPLSFGHNMKLEWDNRNYYSQLYKYSGKDIGKVTLKYKIDLDDYTIKIRLFDPPLPYPNITIQSPINNTNYSTNSVDLNWTVDTNTSWCAYTLDGGATTSNLCYQESANTTNQTGIDGNCGLNYSGKYYMNGSWDGVNNHKAYDGAFNTNAAAAGFPSSFFVNYTKPNYTVYSAKWYIDYNPTNWKINITIPQDSFNLNTLQFKIYLDIFNATHNIYYFYVVNSSNDWNLLYTSLPTDEGGAIQEEAMWWTISSSNSGSYKYNFTNLGYGNYYVNASVWDYVNHINSTNTLSIILLAPPPPSTLVNYSCGNTRLQFRINGSNLYEQGIEPVGQNSSCPAYNITNNGTGSGSNITVNLNSSMPSGIEMYCNSSTSNTLCYQETANVSTVCGGLSTGAYANSSSLTSGYIFINYSKPASSLNSSLWQVKAGNQSNIANYSIPSLCWSQDVLQFRFWSEEPSYYYYYLDCYNGTAFTNIHSGVQPTSGYSGGSDNVTRAYDGDWSSGIVYDYSSGTYNWKDAAASTNHGIWEEAMWWNVTGINLNTSTKTIYSGSIPSGSSVGVWCYLNLNNPSSGKLGKVIFNITN